MVARNNSLVKDYSVNEAVYAKYSRMRSRRIPTVMLIFYNKVYV